MISTVLSQFFRTLDVTRVDMKPARITIRQIPQNGLVHGQVLQLSKPLAFNVKAQRQPLIVNKRNIIHCTVIIFGLQVLCLSHSHHRLNLSVLQHRRTHLNSMTTIVLRLLSSLSMRMNRSIMAPLCRRPADLTRETIRLIHCEDARLPQALKTPATIVQSLYHMQTVLAMPVRTVFHSFLHPVTLFDLRLPPRSQLLNWTTI